jgi:hypothetical protein
MDTAERAAVAALAPVELRGSAFGLLAAVQGFGSLAASAIAVLWTLVSPRMAFRSLVSMERPAPSVCWLRPLSVGDPRRCGPEPAVPC